MKTPSARPAAQRPAKRAAGKTAALPGGAILRWTPRPWFASGSGISDPFRPPVPKKSLTTRATLNAPCGGVRAMPELPAVLAWLKKHGTKKVRDSMARYGLPSDRAVGVSVGELQKYAKQLGRSHELAGALWASGVYEARLLAAFVDEPEQITVAQMDAWCRDFDNWGVVDTVCFKLFDQSPQAWSRVAPWAEREEEFQRRAGFVLLACLAGHDREAGDEKFLRLLPLCERHATDARNFVKKGVSWALRMIGERSPALNAAATAVARRLADATDVTARWIGKDVLRQLASAAVRKRLAARVRG